jgi:hypothetical protein
VSLPAAAASSSRQRPPLAWIDDELAADAFVWAAKRDAAASPTLLVKTAPHVGVTAAHVEQLAAFAQAI